MFIKDKGKEGTDMAQVYAFMAEGMEEVECLATADVLIRGGVEVTFVSIGQEKIVKGSHGIRVVADISIEEADFSKADVLFLPGGMPGTRHLAECQRLTDALVKANEAGTRIAAICAAPSVLGGLGILKGKTATCYPGFEGALVGAEHTDTGVVTDGTVTTARGLGYALDLGLELLRILKDEKTAKGVKTAIQYDQC